MVDYFQSFLKMQQGKEEKDRCIKLCTTQSRLLTHSPIHHFEIFPVSKKLQTTTEMWLLKDFKIQIA